MIFCKIATILVNCLKHQYWVQHEYLSLVFLATQKNRIMLFRHFCHFGLEADMHQHNT
jgi:hypothetical protein